MGIKHFLSKFKLPILRRDDEGSEETDTPQPARPIVKMRDVPLVDTLPNPDTSPARWGADAFDPDAPHTYIERGGEVLVDTRPKPYEMPPVDPGMTPSINRAASRRYAVPSALGVQEEAFYNPRMGPIVAEPLAAMNTSPDRDPRVGPAFDTPLVPDVPPSTNTTENGGARPRFAVPRQVVTNDSGRVETDNVMYDPEVQGITRPRINDRRGFIQDRITEEEAAPPQNKNSRIASILKTGGKLFLRSLQSGGSLGQAVGAAATGAVYGGIKPESDERLDWRKNIAKDRGEVGRMDEREDATLKREKTRAEVDAARALAEQRRRGPKPGAPHTRQIQDESGNRYYQTWNPQNSEWEDDVNRAGERELAGQRAPIITTGEYAGMTQSQARAAKFRDERRKQQEASLIETTLSDGRKIKVSPATAAHVDALRENREYERGRKEDQDTQEARAASEEASAYRSDAEIYEGNASTEEQLAEAARARGDDDAYDIHVGEANRLRTEARDLRQRATASEAKAKSKPSPVRYRGGKRRGSGGSSYNVDLNKYGLNP